MTSLGLPKMESSAMPLLKADQNQQAMQNSVKSQDPDPTRKTNTI